MNIASKLLLSFSLVTSFNLRAEEIPGMTDFFVDQMALVHNEINTAGPVVEGAESVRYSYNRLLLDINPHVGFGIRGIANLTINPEIQFMWEKIPAAN